jgi:hypothetical protein
MQAAALQRCSATTATSRSEFFVEDSDAEFADCFGLPANGISVDKPVADNVREIRRRRHLTDRNHGRVHDSTVRGPEPTRRRHKKKRLACWFE